MLAPSGVVHQGRMVTVQHWFEELRRLMPTD